MAEARILRLPFEAAAFSAVQRCPRPFGIPPNRRRIPPTIAAMKRPTKRHFAVAMTMLTLTTACSRAPATTLPIPTGPSNMPVLTTFQPIPPTTTTIPPRSGLPVGSGPHCAAVSLQLVARVLEIPLDGPFEDMPTIDSVNCVFTDPGHIEERPGRVAVGIVEPDDPENFAKGRASLDTSGLATTDLLGIGDEAYVHTGTGFNVVVARKGKTTFSVVGDPTVDQERAIVQQLLATTS